MQRCSMLLVLAVSFFTTVTAGAQFKDAGSNGPKLGQPSTQRWRAGMVITSGAGPCVGLKGYTAVPTDWPEQEVQLVDEDVSPTAKISEWQLERSVKVMVVNVSMLAPRAEARAVQTFEIVRRAMEPPENTDIYVLPETRKLPRDMRVYLAPSPKIETTHPKIRTLARQLGTDTSGAWQTVEEIYDWVRDNVEYKNGPLKGAVAALQDGTGDCEELTSLFIAICRAKGIPARTVWVPGHCYPEFYLMDDQDEGYWFPCQAAGSRAFGGIPELRPILQKGDNFRPPYPTAKRQRYLAEHLTGRGGQPRVKFIREAATQ